MLGNKTIAVVVPAYNEEKQIGRVIETMPEFVDRIIIVNDSSLDDTESKIKAYLNTEYNNTRMPVEEEQINQTFYNEADLFLEKMNKQELKFFTPSRIINENPVNSRIILITNLKNIGVGGSIARGYKWCKDHNMDCTAVMAGDGQMDPDELESICSPVINERIDYVKGNRLIHRSANVFIPRVRFFVNSILSLVSCQL